MSKSGASSFLWSPGHGADPLALGRLAEAFPKPKKPMGEAWFMGDERQLYPELLGDLDELTDDQLTRPLEEIASGISSFGPMDEWTEWFHYLLPRLLERNWGWRLFHPAELLITGFIAQHPDNDGSLPYPAFRTDALATLGQLVMSPHFWRGSDSEIPKCFNKWEGPTGICGWFRTDGLLSGSLFFCIKYLPASLVGPWFQSVASISNKYWRAQLITWLVGAHPILTNKISQPSQFPEDLHFGVGWEWSRALDGNYSGDYEPPIPLTTFLPAENREAVLEVARGMETDEFFEELLTDPQLEAVAAETAGLPEYFLELYGKAASDG